MPEIPVVTVDVSHFRTKKQQQLLAMLNDKGVKTKCNEMILKTINDFVPMKTGALRKSGRATSEFIIWGEGLEYARYQYGGEVYGPNLPGLENGSPAWRSRKGKPKHPMGRELGVPGFALLRPKWQKGGQPYSGLVLYKFGYTTPGTHHHWDRYFTYAPKMKTNLEITRYLKAECKRRGLKT